MEDNVKKLFEAIDERDKLTDCSENVIPNFGVSEEQFLRAWFKNEFSVKS